MSEETKKAEDARSIIVNCEREIKQIKAAVRLLPSPGDPSSEGEGNSLEVCWLSVASAESIGEGKYAVSLQLSSPVEDALLTTVKKDGDEDTEGAVATFARVETSVATLVVSIVKDGNTVGLSESFDLSNYCKLEDPLNPKESYVHKLDVSIYGTVVTASEEKESIVAQMDEKDESGKIEVAEETAETEGEAKKTETERDDTVEAESTSSPAEGEDKADRGEEPASKANSADSETKDDGTELCGLTLQLTYKPSTKDQREALYEQLNKVSERKSDALKTMRQLSTISAKKSPTSVSPGSKKQPAVKAGFLNKKATKDAEQGLLQKWYEQTIGPQSVGRAVFMVAKNYIIFFGAMALFHFKGQELALPAPV